MSSNIKKILFVCHGNICRSPMAEMVMKELVRKAGLENEFFIDSAACHTDEIGNTIHWGTRKKLLEKEIPFTDHRARLIKKSDYDDFDFIVAMDRENISDLKFKFPFDRGEKIRKLLDYCGNKDVADPWYTGNFDKTWDDIFAGCSHLLEELKPSF